MRKPPLRVVVAEDEALIGLDLKEMLQEEGYEVTGEASDGETAVKLAVSHRPDLRISMREVAQAVLDRAMAGPDGSPGQ